MMPPSNAGTSANVQYTYAVVAVVDDEGLELPDARAVRVADSEDEEVNGSTATAATTVEASTEADIVSTAAVAVGGTRTVETSSGRALTVLETPTGQVPTDVPAIIRAQGVMYPPSGLRISERTDQIMVIERNPFRENPVSHCFSVSLVVFLAALWNFSIFKMLTFVWWMIFLPHFWAGIYLVYFVICFIFNKTYITVTRNEIEVEERPVNCCVAKQAVSLEEDATEIICKRNVVHNEGHASVSYHLEVVNNNSTGTLGEDDDPKRVIIQNWSMESTLYIQQEIENFLVQERRDFLGRKKEEDDLGLGEESEIV
jgi:hypothetical protein